MNFELNDEQRMLSDSVSRFLSDRYDFEKRRKYMEMEGGFDPKIWQGYAEFLPCRFRKMRAGLAAPRSRR